MSTTGLNPVITLEELPGCLLVKFHGIQVAASSHVLVLHEANYPPVYYVPREDIDDKYFARTDHTSYCPYKGDANYFSLQIPGHEAANAVWTYSSDFSLSTDSKLRFAGGFTWFFAQPEQIASKTQRSSLYIMETPS
jgi:uncharacterized protein (DUF427 family)